MRGQSLVAVQGWAFDCLLALADHFDPHAQELRAGLASGIAPRALLALYPYRAEEWTMRAQPVLAGSEAVRNALTSRHGVSTLLGDALMGESHSHSSQLWAALQAVDDAGYDRPAPELLRLVALGLIALTELREIRWPVAFDAALPYFCNSVEALLSALRGQAV